jgi:hypothetical protein
VREPIAAVVDQLLLGDLGVVLRHDEGDHRLAPPLVGRSDHRHLADRRMGVQRVLHLDAGDVLPTGDDDVLLAVDDGDVALVVDHGAVAGVEPSVAQRRGRCLRLLPVPGQDVVAADQQLALVIDRDPHADGGGAGPTELPRARPG